MTKPHTINTGVAICDQANTTPQEGRDSIPANADLQPSELPPSPLPASIVSLWLPVPLARSFDYLLPAGLELKPGVRVSVNFAGRRLIGLVAKQQTCTAPPEQALKPVEAVLDNEPLLPAELWQLLDWASRYYHHPMGEVLFTALPVLLRAGEPATASPAPGIRLKPGASLAPECLKRTSKLQQLWDLLQNQGYQDLKALRAQGYGAQIRRLQQWQLLIPATAPTPLPTSSATLTLTDSQQQVLEQIGPLTGFKSILLQGITGSGKTEVYLRLLQQVLSQGRQALVLIPEIGLTAQTLARFQQALTESVVCLNSSLTDRARLDAWLSAAQGEARVVIGTRSALFTPMPDLGLILIDEEHDASFRQQEGFKYSARDLALVRARNLGIPIVLGSATPSMESLAQARQQRSLWLQMNQRATGQALAQIRLLDIRQQRLHHGLTEFSLERIRTELAKQQQVLIFLNRRGFAPQLLCHGCGFVLPCSHCDVSLTLHMNPARLSCHHCGRQSRPPRHCPQCGGSELLPQGLATAGLEQALAQLLPEARLLRIDRDSTRRKGSLDAQLDAVHHGQFNLLIGTQMLAKGHHFKRLSLVIVLDADSALFSLDFRAPERLAQLLLQVAGRAGREGAGEVLIQTRQPEHEFWPQILKQDYQAFASQCLQQRQQAELPPYSHLALIRASSRHSERAEAFLQSLKSHASIQGVDYLGPVPAPLARKDNQHRWQLLLSSPQRKPLHQALNLLQQLNAESGVRWSIEVDPQELA